MALFTEKEEEEKGGPRVMTTRDSAKGGLSIKERMAMMNRGREEPVVPSSLAKKVAKRESKPSNPAAPKGLGMTGKPSHTADKKTDKKPAALGMGAMMMG